MMTRPALFRTAGWFFAIFLLVLHSAVTARAQDAMSRILERQELVVGVKADYGPWGHYDVGGRLVGFEPDIAQELAGRLGVRLRLVVVTSANRLGKLEQGSIDLMIATMGDTVERRKVADLLQPHYYASAVRLLLPKASPLTSWSQLRGRPVCISSGAYFNRHLTENLLVVGQQYAGARDAAQALKDGYCVGWAFDDTILAQTMKQPGWEDYRLGMQGIQETPWVVAVRRGEGDAPFGRFVSDTIAELHRNGRLLELQEEWIGLPSVFLEEKQELWSREADGKLVCERQADGQFPAECLSNNIATGGGKAFTLPDWARRLRAGTGLDAGSFLDPYNRSRLLRGFVTTIAISVASIIGSLVIGFGMALAIASLAGGTLAARCVAWGLRAIIAIAQLTPPILQLYILFFGIAVVIRANLGVSLDVFWIAAFVFSLYAGATNAVLIQSELSDLSHKTPDARPSALLSKAALGAYDGLFATCINIVKAAGMASTIALFDMITAVNDLIAEGADKFTMMNFLLLFYLTFVIILTSAFNFVRKRLAR